MQRALRRRYPVLHIASHFQFRPGDETASFLLLGDGSHLSVAEIAEQDLFRGLDLLTLSACETALGGQGATGKEIDGLGELAQRQGAKAVIATLWPVADASTKELMQTFYELRESQPGLPKVEALRQAQLRLLAGQGQVVAMASAVERGLKRLDEDSTASTETRFVPTDQAPYAHPYYWAPFILIGNWK
jgi:CHAT domain-containing protein